jgi:LysM repeat protein
VNQLTPNNDSGTNQYIIQEGDTMWEIANQYNTSVETLMASNPEVDPDNMLVGQVLLIPEQRGGPTRPQRPPQAPTRRRAPRADWRDRRGRRVRRYPARPWLRPYPRPFRPYPGQRFCPRGATAYYVQAGDSLYSLAVQFGVSIDYIISANPYINFNLPLQIGQIICIP